MRKGFIFIGHFASLEKHTLILLLHNFTILDDSLADCYIDLYDSTLIDRRNDLKTKQYYNKYNKVITKIKNMLQIDELSSEIALKHYIASRDIKYLHLCSLMLEEKDYSDTINTIKYLLQDELTIEEINQIIRICDKCNSDDSIQKAISIGLSLKINKNWKLITNAIKSHSTSELCQITYLDDDQLYFLLYTINYQEYNNKSVVSWLYFYTINHSSYANIQLATHQYAKYICSWELAAVQYYALNYSYKKMKAFHGSNAIISKIALFTEKINNVLMLSKPTPVTMLHLQTQLNEELDSSYSKDSKEFVIIVSNWLSAYINSNKLHLQFIYFQKGIKEPIVTTVKSFGSYYRNLVFLLQQAFVQYGKLADNSENYRVIFNDITNTEKQIGNLLANFEDKCMEQAKILLLGDYPPQIQQQLNQINTQFNHKYIQYLLTLSMPSIYSIAKPKELSDKLIEIKQTINDTMLRNPVTIIIDNKISLFPFEHLKLYATQQQQLTRIFSLKDVQPQVEIDQRIGYCILNPDGDLKSSQERMENYFFNRRMWKGVAGKAPENTQIVNAITTNDLFVYCGHGNGSKYCDYDTIKKAKVKATVFLMGCGSCFLNQNGMYENSGIVQSYLQSSWYFIK